MLARKVPDFQQFTSVITTIVLVGGTVAAANIFGSKLPAPCLVGDADAKEWILLGGVIGTLLVGTTHIWVAYRQNIAWAIIAMMIIGYGGIAFGAFRAPPHICPCGTKADDWEKPWFQTLLGGVTSLCIAPPRKPTKQSHVPSQPRLEG